MIMLIWSEEDILKIVRAFFVLMIIFISNLKVKKKLK